MSDFRQKLKFPQPCGFISWVWSGWGNRWCSPNKMKKQNEKKIEKKFEKKICWTPQYGCVWCNRVPSNFGVTMFRVNRFRETMFRETMFRPTIFWVAIVRVTIVWIEMALSDLVPFVHPYIHPCSFTNITSELKLKKNRKFSKCQILDKNLKFPQPCGFISWRHYTNNVKHAAPLSPKSFLIFGETLKRFLSRTAPFQTTGPIPFPVFNTRPLNMLRWQRHIPIFLARR